LTTPPTTRIATATRDDITIRGRSLPGELLGRVSFTEMMLLQLLGELPDPARARAVDACLVALMEHGLTPSTIAARLVYSNSPEALQAGVAAGLLAVGSVFVGTTENCARLLARMVAAADLDAEARAIVAEHRAARRELPGFGHPQHVPDDPRTPRLLSLARDLGVAGRHIAAVERLSAALDAALGRHLTINATGAVAAVLADCGIPVEIMRGFALVARCAGLVGHLHEEQHRPAMRAMWEAAARAVPYDAGPTPAKAGEP
jgi:citrate synthase